MECECAIHWVCASINYKREEENMTCTWCSKKIKKKMSHVGHAYAKGMDAGGIRHYFHLDCYKKHIKFLVKK